MSTDEKYMKRCLDLAKNGLGNVSPNPMVGCVIVCEGKIIGEGYHAYYGGPHAEVNAINSVKDKELLQKSVLYVNLEPCSHFGKTPPCADLIIKNKIPEVVIGSTDPNSKVCGKGMQKLKDASCKITTGILEKECRELNKRFFTFHEKKRPYIILKWAQSSDGFIDIIRSNQSENRPTWITSENTRILVHKWRTEEDAVMVGTNTARMDNPMLNVRDWKGRNPLRVAIDKSLTLPESLNLFDKSSPTVVFTSVNHKSEKNLEYVIIDFTGKIIEQILKTLYEKEVLSVIIEGGEKLLNSFIKENLWDEARVFTGNKTFNDGIKAPYLDHKPALSEKLPSGDILNFFRNNT